MEILIPGLILVALMIYVSTKIKKNAAQAYEREIIETDRFSVVKPEGFIQPIDESLQAAFRAYSKDFGIDDTADLRQAWVEVRIHENANFEECRDEIAKAVSNIVSEQPYMDASEKAVVIEAEQILKDVSIHARFKLIKRGDSVIELRISVLPESKDAYFGRMEEMMESFEVK
ncbi:MAG: hypothetical protein ACT4O9_09835 [Blastocatellia bacterium]